ncbi:putative uncharacterized protein DDB_G0267716 [Condylostylus longicornis]|uniref:putative uncharacterized protein DDB_G0267716 n=1 Tax=Condylostylus longicornis TaxID=2530218 RepID=UPI00244E2B02|nr:putative uncharacterized protein DDB_G0267716 [Condylostylus longicornis]
MNLMLGPLAQGALLLSIIYWYSKTMMGMINEYYRDELKKTLSDVPDTYPNEITEIVEEKEDDDVTLKTPYVSSPTTDGIPDILKEAAANNGDNGILTRAFSDNNNKEKTQESFQLNQDDNLLNERFSILLREREEEKQKEKQYENQQIEEDEKKQEYRDEEKQNNVQNENENLDGKKLQTNFPSIIDNDKHQLCEKYSIRNEQKLLDFNLENLCFPSGKQLNNFEVQDNVGNMKENEYIKKTKSSELSNSSYSTKSKNPLTLQNEKEFIKIENSILKSSTADELDYITVRNQYNKNVKPSYQQSSSNNKLQPQTTKNFKNEEELEEKNENFPLKQNLKNKNFPLKPDKSNELKQNYLQHELNVENQNDNSISVNSKIKNKNNIKSKYPYPTTSDNKNIFQSYNSVVDDGKRDGNYNFLGENSFKKKNHQIKMRNSLSSFSSISTISTDSDDDNNNDGNINDNFNHQPSYNKISSSKSKKRSYSASVSDNIDVISKVHVKSLSTSSSISSTSSLESRRSNGSYKKKFNNKILTNRDLNCRRKSVSEYIEFWSNLK